MRYMVFALSVAVATSWLLNATVQADEGSSRIRKRVSSHVAGDGEVRLEAKVIVVEDAGSGHTMKFVSAGTPGESSVVRKIVINTDGQAGTAGEHRGFLVKSGDRTPVDLNGVANVEFVADSGSENRGWLGVQLGQTMTSEDSDGIEGISILNVAEGSPADLAGFEQNDLVIEVNDRAIGSDLGVLVSEIGDSGPGKRMKFTVMRGGERRTLVATLANRSEIGDTVWAYESVDNAFLRESVNSTFSFILKDDEGNWVVNESGNLDHLPQIAGIVGKYLPQHLGKQVEVRIDNGEVNVSTTVTDDGETVTVTREGEGPIVVTRVDENGTETVTEYADGEALSEGDAVASEIFADASDQMVTIKLDSDHDFPFVVSGWNKFGFTPGEGPQGAWFGASDDSMRQHIEEVMASLKNMNITVDMDLSGAGDGHKVFAQRLHTHRASRSIQVNADGSIDVTIRKGSDELIHHYTDAADLEDRDAETYERYLDLIDADVDE